MYNVKAKCIHHKPEPSIGHQLLILFIEAVNQKLPVVAAAILLSLGSLLITTRLAIYL